nr:MAG TPA: hypothetical protein [Crassvirales sp.]
MILSVYITIISLLYLFSANTFMYILNIFYINNFLTSFSK